MIWALLTDPDDSTAFAPRLLWLLCAALCCELYTSYDRPACRSAPAGFASNDLMLLGHVSPLMAQLLTRSFVEMHLAFCFCAVCAMLEDVPLTLLIAQQGVCGQPTEVGRPRTRCWAINRVSETSSCMAHIEQKHRHMHLNNNRRCNAQSAAA